VRWRATAIDVVVAGVAFAVSASVLSASRPVAADLREPDALGYVLLAVYSASVVARRRAPASSVAVSLLAGVAYAGLDYPLALTPLALLPVYSAAAELPPRRARLVLAGSVVLGALGATLSPGPTDVGVPALLISAWMLGSYVGSRRTYTAALEKKNRLLEQAQLDLADQAVAEERLRIARELHDVVAHTMSVVAVHAGTGRMVAEENPAAARDALVTIETATRSALVEMRRLLGVLRGAGDAHASGLEPAPGLGDLDALVADVVQSGVTVEVRVEGRRPSVPQGVDLSAYRIVQEALTNVIKHAGRAHTTVAVRYSEHDVQVEVSDAGRTPVLSPAPAGGHGLAGMRERVAMYGGELEAGPSPTGGYRVAARLPFGDAT
jgi:signal transduction histidine kinase